MIKNLTIKNFRALEDTEIKNIVQFNLFGGHFGKSSVIDVINLLCRHNNLQNCFIPYTENNVHQFDNSKTISIGLETESSKELLEIGVSTYSNISFNNDFESLVFNGYSEELLNKVLVILQRYELGLTEVKQDSAGSILFKTSTLKFSDISLFGKGVKKLFKVVLDVLSGSKIILLDDVDFGVHHSKIELFWKIIFEICLEHKVQVFATTNSLEMILYYVKVVEELYLNYCSTYFEICKHIDTKQVLIRNRFVIHDGIVDGLYCFKDKVFDMFDMDYIFN